MSTSGGFRALVFLAAASGILPALGQNQNARELMDAGKDTLGKPAPELISAGWVGSPVALRGVRGNTVVLNFWNSDSTYFDTPEYFIKSMMADYDKYSKLRNMTFVSICRSMTATLKQVEKDVNQFRVKPFATMLDAGGATAHAYKVPKEYSTWIVIIDPDGKILYNRNKGWTWSGGPDAGKQVHHTNIEESQKRSPGILDKKVIPEVAAQAAHLFDLQQFQAAELEIKRLEAFKTAPDDVKEFTVFLREKIADTRRKRLEEVQQLSATAPVQAYREAVNFVTAFPNCPEKVQMNDIGKSLSQNPAVKKELQAEDAYRRIILPELAKTPKGTAEFTQRVQPALDGYLKVFGGTEYAAAVTDGVEGYKLAAGRSR
jgi:peroxiredoxin